MRKPKIAAIVECRMTSSRLPGKVMMKSCGKTMLQYIAERLSRVKQIDRIIFATTGNTTDDIIAEHAEETGVDCFRGPEDDVLSRVLEAANHFDVDIIVEITGDCPLIDPGIIADTIDLYLAGACDYAANDLTASFPLGMDVEIFSKNLLEIADREGMTADDREHVSWFFVRNPDRFHLKNLSAPPELYWPDLRLTLDEKDDFRLIDAVLQGILPDNPHFTLADIISFLRNNRTLLKLNAHVCQRNPEQTA